MEQNDFLVDDNVKVLITVKLGEGQIKEVEKDFNTLLKATKFVYDLVYDFNYIPAWRAKEKYKDIIPFDNTNRAIVKHIEIKTKEEERE